MPIAALSVAIALVIGWALQGRQEEPLSAIPSSAEPMQDAYIEDFVSVEMDARGRPTRRLEAESLVRYRDGTSRLAQPRYRFRRSSDGTIWQARSDRGWLLPLDRSSLDPSDIDPSTAATVDDERILRLAGKVNIWREDDPDAAGAADPGIAPQEESARRRAIDISVEELEIRPATGYAGSDSFVTILTPGSQTQGQGLRVWLNEGKFALLSRVSTRIDDPKRIP